MNFDINIFVAEAIAYQKKIYKNIDNLYIQKRFEFYKHAKDSNFYNSNIITDNDFIKEEYSKKVLGILIYISKNNDMNILDELINITKVAFSYTYAYVQNNTNIEFSRFLKNYRKKIDRIDNISADIINHNLVMLNYYSIILQKKIVHSNSDHIYTKYIELINNRLSICDDEKVLINIDYNNKEIFKRLKSCRKLIEKNGLSKITTMTNQNLQKDILQMINYIFDYERITPTIIDDLTFDNIDIDEIIYNILVVNGDFNENNFDEFIVLAHIKQLLKKIKELKQHYIDNNKETMFVELEEVKTKKDNLSHNLKLLNEQITTLKNELGKKEKQINKQKKLLNDSKYYEEELNSLREFIFNIENNDIEENTTKQIETIDNYLIVIGGTDNWQQKMKKVMPNTIFINTDNMHYDTNLIKKVDMIFIYTNYINHSIYFKTISAAQKFNKKIGYINQSNEKLILNNIFDLITKSS